MLCIIDYGIGNLRSIEKALEAVGADVLRSDKPEDILRASHVVLPGVGAFGACADEIRKRDLVAPILAVAKNGTPLLGVCVGLQLLFDFSEEMGTHEGLGLIPGKIARFQHTYEPVVVAPGTEPAGEAPLLKIPHMGWNTIQQERTSPLLDGLPDKPHFYFVHSYHAAAHNPSDVLAYTTYGIPFPSIVQRNNVFGVQFHPEKSHTNGLHVLKNFSTL